ncbi:hypothetical protein chiPu_0014887 [Chiloscyllium punctatum]|uniref:Uncharacterized protein n=1 Tax=Chiloscyllium punctatum TaxID=137246 RepID=A0A401T162_CHIPU|nr:hypothetical protein [Chiloscyllium punctatum]
MLTLLPAVPCRTLLVSARPLSVRRSLSGGGGGWSEEGTTNQRPLVYCLHSWLRQHRARGEMEVPSLRVRGKANPPLPAQCWACVNLDACSTCVEHACARPALLLGLANPTLSTVYTS